MNDKIVAAVAAMMSLHGLFIFTLGITSVGTIAIIAGAIVCVGSAWVGISAWRMGKREGGAA